MNVAQARRCRSALWVAVAVLFSVCTLGLVWHGATTAQVAQQGAPPEAALHAEEMSRAFRGAAEAILPTVVTIETVTKPKAIRGTRRPQQNPFKGTPFEEFFNDEFGMGGEFFGRGIVPRNEGTGSGVIIDKSGLILTNNHVVEGADEVIVRLQDGREFKASDIRTDPQSDLAVVRIGGAGSLPSARLGNSDLLEIGDWVIAVGAPFGLDATVSAGIISGKGRELNQRQRTRYLQTDAAINPGNSGGPLVNLRGEVVGINTAIASNSGGYQGIGFAIPANLAGWVVGQLVDKGAVQRAYLGVGIEELNAELAEQFGVERHAGVLVAQVYPGSPAAKAGFQEGDIISQYAGNAVRTPRDLQELVERASVNVKQTVKVIRDGKTISLEVAPDVLPDDLVAAERPQPKEGGRSARPSAYFDEQLGIEVADLTEQLATELGIEATSGVVITEVSADGPAALAGLRPGMVIREVGRKPVENRKEFEQAMSGQNVADGVLLLIRTERGNRFVVIKQR